MADQFSSSKDVQGNVALEKTGGLPTVENGAIALPIPSSEGLNI